MRGVIPPLSNTSPWRDAQLKAQEPLYLLPFYIINVIIIIFPLHCGITFRIQLINVLHMKYGGISKPWWHHNAQLNFTKV
jgi:hypothetical protein